MIDLDFMWANAGFIAEGLKPTLLLSFLALVLAILLAVLLAALERGIPPFSAITSFYISLIGGTPLLLQVFFIFLAFPQIGILLSGFWAGVIVLGMNHGARFSEIFRQDPSFLTRGQGATWPSRMPTLIDEFIALIRNSTLLVVAGFVQDVMWRATRVGRATFHNLEALTIAIFLYWAVALILSALQKGLFKDTNTVAVAGQPGFDIRGLVPPHLSATQETGGFLMGSAKNETTRFLCASAVTAGSRFRDTVLNHLRSKPKAITPEVGLDLLLIAQVCNFMERRELKYRIWFGLLVISGFLLSLLSPFAILLPVVASAVLWYYQTYEERFTLTPFFTRERFDPAEISKKFRVDLDHEILNGIPSDDQNLIVYSEFSPFAGAGIDLGGWVFSINTCKPKDQKKDTTSFELSELYELLESNGNTLLLPELSIKDTLFVHGTAIREDRSILSNVFNRPLQSLSAELVKQYSTANDFRIRHYKRFMVQDWGNEMIFSLFLRCSLRGPNLFVEVNRFLLTPLSDQYHRIDSLPPKSWRVLSSIGTASLLAGPLTAVLDLLLLTLDGLGALAEALGVEERSLRQQIQQNPRYNYGSSNSLRQLMSSQRYANYFQKLDREMYIRVLDREILDTIVDFLDEHNVDTSELKSQQTAILNSGIFIQGGNLEAQSVAVGSGSQAVTTSKPVDVSKPTKKE